MKIPVEETLFNPSCPKHPKIIEIKSYINFYFYTSSWCFRKIYKSQIAFIKPFEAPERSVKMKNLYHFSPVFRIGTTRVKTMFLLNSRLVPF